NAANFNRGLRPGEELGFFFDTLRAAKRAGIDDGIKRESWLTEFGWDSVSGPAVSAAEQAAYLQRGFLPCFAAGTDRSFWFYSVESEQPPQIFESCGLCTHDEQPRPARAAMAGLTALRPRPVLAGTIYAGGNSAGYIIETDGQLVAGL